MDWDKLRVFHEVAEAGSFTHAGETLGLSQSAVSRQISGLEQNLKVPLFHRHARGLILTEQGEILYRTAHDVFSRLAATQTRLMDSREKPTGPLKVTTTVGVGSIWLTPHLPEFLDLYPDITVELLLSDRDLDLGMREADIAIRLHRPTEPDLIQRKLFTVHNHAYAAPEYLREYGMPKSVADLDNHRIMAFGVPPAYLSEIDWLLKVDRPDNNPRTPILTINNVYGLRRAAQMGIGITTIPDYIVGTDTNLVMIPLDQDPPAFDTYLAYAEEMRASKRVAVFRDFVVSKARQWSF
ncbi:MAG: LysR family transcriptional regulator [Rhizobiales bacterium]|nr:LysR family transcriptional regulator [Hyphomicrobiales bacterium]